MVRYKRLGVDRKRFDMDAFGEHIVRVREPVSLAVECCARGRYRILPHKVVATQRLDLSDALGVGVRVLFLIAYKTLEK